MSNLNFINIAYFEIGLASLAELLGLPEDAIIRFAMVDKAQGKIALYVLHKDLPAIPVSAQVPKIEPVFLKKEGKQVFMLSWGGGDEEKGKKGNGGR